MSTDDSKNFKIFKYLTCIKSLDGIPLLTRCFPANKQVSFDKSIELNSTT